MRTSHALRVACFLLLFLGLEDQPYGMLWIRDKLFLFVDRVRQECREIVDHLQGKHQNNEDSYKLLGEEKNSNKLGGKRDGNEIAGGHVQKMKSGSNLAVLDTGAKKGAQRRNTGVNSRVTKLKRGKGQKIDYRRVLRVEKSATDTEIQQKYIEKFLTQFPHFKPNPPDFVEEFGKVIVAYKSLTDTSWRNSHNLAQTETNLKCGITYADEVFSTIFCGKSLENIIGKASYRLRMFMLESFKKDPKNQKLFDPQHDVSNIFSYNRPHISKVESSQDEMSLGQRNEPGENSHQNPDDEFYSAVVEHLSEKLEEKLSTYLNSVNSHAETSDPESSSGPKIWVEEVKTISNQLGGPEILKRVGSIYVSHAKRHLLDSRIFNWIELMKVKFYHHLYMFLSSTAQLEISFAKKMTSLAKIRGFTSWQMRKMESKCAELFLICMVDEAFWDIEKVVNEVCRRTLQKPGLSPGEAKERAQALRQLGQSYLSAVITAENKYIDRFRKEIKKH